MTRITVMSKQKQRHHPRFTPAASPVGMLKGGWRAIRMLWRMEDTKDFAMLMALAILWSLGWAALCGYGLMFLAIGTGHFRQSRKPRGIIERGWRNSASDAMMLIVIILLADNEYGLANIVGSWPPLLNQHHMWNCFTGLLLGWVAGFMVWPSVHKAWQLSLSPSRSIRHHRHPVRMGGRNAISPSRPLTRPAKQINDKQELIDGW